MGVFDIVGPVMIGPSSSHTAGAARIGLMARNILKDEPVRAEITVYGSFAKTYKGHGTDKALVAGLLGLTADDVRLRNSFSLAASQGLEIVWHRSDVETPHPNTVRIAVSGSTGKSVEVVGVSLGGGRIAIKAIDGFDVELTGEEHTLVTRHIDQPGVIARATTIMAQGEINVSNMRVFRRSKHADAVVIICTDSPVPPELVEAISHIPHVEKVITLLPI